MMLAVYVKSLKKKGYMVQFQYAPVTRTGLGEGGKLMQQTTMVPTCLVITEDGEFGIGPLEDIAPLMSKAETTVLKQVTVPKKLLEKIEPTAEEALVAEIKKAEDETQKETPSADLNPHRSGTRL